MSEETDNGKDNGKDNKEEIVTPSPRQLDRRPGRPPAGVDSVHRQPGVRHC